MPPIGGGLNLPQKKRKRHDLVFTADMEVAVSSRQAVAGV